MTGQKKEIIQPALMVLGNIAELIDTTDNVFSFKVSGFSGERRSGSQYLGIQEQLFWRTKRLVQKARASNAVRVDPLSLSLPTPPLSVSVSLCV